MNPFDRGRRDFGWPEYAPADLAGGEPEEKAERVRRVIGGHEAGAGRAAVVLNAAAAFWAAGDVDTLAAGVAAAEQSIDSGAAEAHVRLCRHFDRQHSPADS